MVLGRTHIKDVAAKRKVELNSYIQSLMNASTDVSEVILQSTSIYLLHVYVGYSKLMITVVCFLFQFQCDLVYTFFHPLLRDEKAEAIDGIAKNTGETTF